MGTQTQNRPNFSTDIFTFGLEFFHTEPFNKYKKYS
jgi:hypothetical protein